jgi:hypothetical protein
MPMGGLLRDDASSLPPGAERTEIERLERDRPDELRAGLEGLRREVDAGRPPQGRGIASLPVWAAP